MITMFELEDEVLYNWCIFVLCGRLHYEQRYVRSPTLTTCRDENPISSSLDGRQAPLDCRASKFCRPGKRACLWRTIIFSLSTSSFL